MLKTCHLPGLFSVVFPLLTGNKALFGYFIELLDLKIGLVIAFVKVCARCLFQGEVVET